MTNYEFSKLNNTQRWEERNKDWVKKDPEEYVRLLIINDELVLLKNYEKENVNFDFSYQMKGGILFTLAMQKHSYNTIDYLLEKQLTIQARDIETFVKNFREQESQESFLKILNKVNLLQFDINSIFKQLEDCLYEDALPIFLEYVLEKNILINEETQEKLKEYDNLAFLLKKKEKENDFHTMSDRFELKNMKGKNIKI